jgi:hypothetical protein
VLIFVLHSRGKKIFRKFSDDHDAEGDEANDLDMAGQTSRQGPTTRSSIKPRLLFQSELKGKQAMTMATAEDEEAITDIEDHVLDNAEDSEIEMDVPETPIRVADDKIKTPDAPRFGPSSPPSTARVTRSSDKLRDGVTPMKTTKVPSPFDGWRRSKSRPPQSQKRGGEPLTRSPDDAKRQRA